MNKLPRKNGNASSNGSNHLIAMRGRGNYAQAARHLRQIQEIFVRLGDIHGWQRLIANLREENRSLRALQDELNRASL